MEALECQVRSKQRAPRFGKAAWLITAVVVAVPVPAPAQVVNWHGATDDWFTPSNWSTGVVPGPTDDVAIDTTIFTPPVVNASVATAQRLYVGGQFDDITGIASTGTGTLTIANGGQLLNGAGSFFDTFIGVGTASNGGATVSGVGSNWTSTDAVLVGASGATGSLTLNNHGSVRIGALFVGASLADFTGLTITNGAGPSIGTLNLTSSSQLAAGFFADAGVGLGAIGTISVSDAGSTLSSNGGVLIGVLGGTGTLNLTSGGTLTTGPNGPFPFSVIGGGGPSNMGMGPPINGGIGAATISGPGSAWANNGGLFIGGFVDPNNGTLYPGNGALVIADGGSLTSLGGPNSGVPDAIGLGAGSIGTAVVTDPRSQLTAGQNLAVGIAGGTGALTVQNNGAVNVAGIFGVGIGIDPYFGAPDAECNERWHRFRRHGRDYWWWRSCGNGDGRRDRLRVDRQRRALHRWPNGFATRARHRHRHDRGEWCSQRIWRCYACSGVRVLRNVNIGAALGILLWGLVSSTPQRSRSGTGQELLTSITPGQITSLLQRSLVLALSTNSLARRY